MRKLWMDFETRSFVDLKDSGGHRYSVDASTEVLMLAWAYDEDEPSLWLPCLGEPMPEALKAGLLDPDVLKMAWNYNFEKKIFRDRLGIDIPQGQWFDPSLLCSYMALPIGLDRASNALKIDANAKFHLVGKQNPKKIFSIPSKRTKTYLKKNPGAAEFYFKDWNSNPEEWKTFCEYCLQDVRAERSVWHAAVSMKCPFPEVEVQAWLIDQRMNEHGVYIDLDYVNGALKYALAEAAEIEAEMKAITGLEKTGFTTLLMKEWLAKNFYPFKSTDKAHIDEAIKEATRFKLTPECRKILDLKKRLGGSAWSKLQSILDRVSPDGYLRDQFLYHGAHTGRWSGRGVQLQNLFKANGEVSKVLDAVTQAIKTQTLDISAIVETYNLSEKGQKDPCKGFTLMDAVAGTIRSAFSASPNNYLVMCDLAQIESRVLAALAGCQTMIDAYKSGADLYCDFMTWFLKRTITKKDKPERAHGKVVILGCFGADTPVLTGRGWVRIVEVRPDDVVFDGTDFVTHEGVAEQGVREVINLAGVEVTPDHEILSGGWSAACRLKENILLEKRATNLAIGLLSNITSAHSHHGISATAEVAGLTPSSIRLTWKKDELGRAFPVLINAYEKSRTGFTLDGPTSQERQSTDSQIGITPSSLGVVTPFEGTVGKGTQAEGSKTSSLASMNFSGTSSGLKGTITPILKSTELITTEIMSQETFGSSLENKTSPIAVPTFDIRNAGFRHRFMILTESGPMIAHNCGFGMGWEKFIEHAAKGGVVVNEKQAKESVYGFREKYPEIPALWKALDEACKKAVKANICIFVNGLVIDGRNPEMLKIKLPNGRYLHYLRPTIGMEETDWGAMRETLYYESWDEKGLSTAKLYGGLITENVVQAIARDLLVSGMIEAEKLGFVIVMTIHDELVCEAMKGSGLTFKMLEEAMCVVPDWGEGMGFYLGAEGDENPYYKK